MSSESTDQTMQQHGSDEDDTNQTPNFKRQRLLSPEPKQMKIIHLFDDCLEKCFDYLDLRNLFNVAIANEWLRPAVGMVYRREFGKKTVCMNILDEFHKLTCGPYESPNEISVHGFHKCLLYLRCLGPSISHLKIGYGRWTTNQCIHIDEYINKYCAKSLVSLKISNKPKMSSEHIKKPFERVQSLKIVNSGIGNELPSLSALYPNVGKLILSNVCMIKRYIDTPLDHLVDLRIEIKKNGLQYKDVAKLLHQSAQLKSLSIHVYQNQSFTLIRLTELMKSNGTIRKLCVYIHEGTTVDKLTDVQRFVGEHPALIAVNFVGFIFTSETALAFIQQLDGLKRFRFRLDNSVAVEPFVAALDDVGGGSQWKSSQELDYFLRRIINLERFD